ncbi:MAG: hypothetical protein U0670_05575 [Anaerolineae bacterium]
MNMNSLGNVFVKPMLRSPAHRLISKNVLLLSYTGQMGKAYSLPVEYFQHEQTITLFTKAPHGGKTEAHETPVFRLRGKEVKGKQERIFTTPSIRRARCTSTTQP